MRFRLPARPLVGRAPNARPSLLTRAAGDFVARERKRNEALAERIFSRGRRQSAPLTPRHPLGGSLASRAGVNKVRLRIPEALAPWTERPSRRQRVSSAGRSNRRGAPAGDVDGEWTHDLQDSVNHHHRPGPGLGARTSRPAPRGPAAAQRKARLASAAENADVDGTDVQGGPHAGAMGMSIRGLAGPFVVMGQNFAPGTTAADIESAVTPVGGEMVSCSIVKTSPFVMAEMVFVSREGGERVIATFNDKTVRLPRRL